MRPLRKLTIAVAAVSALGMTAACGSDSGSAQESGSDSSSMTAGPSASDSMSSKASDSSSGQMDPAANLVGPGCADYAKAVPDGPGSVQGMAEDPVAVAASNNPMLTTLTAAVSGELNPKVNLVDTLNGGKFTVFAPVDDAFAEVDKATVNKLKKDGDLLTKVLTYHVVKGRLSPDEVTGKHQTVEGDSVKVTGSGDNLMVDDAHVICGGVQTANATVYLIDSVLMPPM